MSTSFFLEWPGEVTGEGRFVPARSIHVCQSGRTWHGIDDSYELEKASATEPLTSVKAWLAHLARAVEQGAVLHDEDGQVFTVDGFAKEWVYSKPMEVRRGGHQWHLDNPGHIGSHERSWWDDEGFSFLRAWFR